MTTSVKERPRARRSKKSFASSLVIGIGAFAFAFAMPLAAHAATIISAEDLDVIEVEATESGLNTHIWDVELLGHDHDANNPDPEFDPASVEYQLAADEDGYAYISEDTDISPLSAGFSPGSSDFLDDLTNPWVTFTLESADWDAADGVTAGGGVIIAGDDIDLDFNADDYDPVSTPQSFNLTKHTHPDWTFRGEGTYTLEFGVSVDYSSPTVVTGLPDTVTVIVHVL
ncbi:hypothetical protein [Bifidobacterium aquikefiricola]|uniref:Uncharacterized protein n=1 Tax=Bifidobacterium aquikefiricola TaxID=3059038 RepID=A0AB39U802_9BIFI